MGLVNITPIEDGTSATANSINEPIGKLAAEINGNLDSSNLKNSSVTTAKIAPGAVTSDKINTSTSVDDNGWTVQDFGTFKIYSRKVTAINVALGEGIRRTIAEVQPPVGRTRDNITFLTSWFGVYGGHAITGTEPVTGTGIAVILAHNWPSELTFNGNINVIAIETL